jgi:hypothetical protein
MAADDKATRAAFWQSHIDEWRATGGSQRAYCEEQGLSYCRFVYWRRKFKRLSSAAPGAAAPLSTPGTRRAFVPVTYTAGRRSDVGLWLVLPNGVEVHGISAENLALVERLLG